MKELVLGFPAVLPEGIFNWDMKESYVYLVQRRGDGHLVTKQEKQRLIEKISAEINILKKLLTVMEETANLPSPDESGNRISLRNIIKMKSADERELRSARVRLTKLESAFRKIDDPEFGTCFICEQPIPLARLLDIPETTRCIKCEEE